MLKRICLVAAIVAGLCASLPAQGQRRVRAGDWPELRGPNRDGISVEKSLINTWKLNGENFLWRVPGGGRSTPIVMGNRVYVQNPSGRGPELQERVMALDVDSGKVVWEYKFSLFQSDVPAHRIAWASPAADPETGNIYALSGGAQVIALSPDGKLLWERSFGEEFAAFTTHGGRTMSPVIDGELVIVSAAVSNWGSAAGRAHRFIGLNKKTGDVIYVANPGGRPYDTAYAPPLIATVNGMRLLIAGLGDGAVHAIKAQTGEKVWSFPAAKRAINTGVAVSGNTVFLSHGDENLEGVDLGLIAALDGAQTGDLKTTKWATKGIEFGYSSPIVDGTRLYQIDNGSTLRAFDTATGKVLWTLPLGAAQKASPVLADGKLYVGTDGGVFFIVRPSADKGEIVSRVELPNSTNSCCGSEGTPEQVLGNVAISRGRIFFMSSDAIYAIGSRRATSPTGFALEEPAAPAARRARASAGLTHRAESRSRAVRDAAVPGSSTPPGRFIREETAATWALKGLEGTVANGVVTIANKPVQQAGIIRATCRRSHRRGACARGASAAMDRGLRQLCRRRDPARMGEHRSWTTGRGDSRRPEGAAEGAARYDLPARADVHRSTELVELHVPGRCAFERAQASDVRRRDHRAALLARALRHVAAVEDRALGAGDGTHGHQAVRLEAERVVSTQAARGEPSQWAGSSAGQGLGGGGSRAGRVDDRNAGSDRQPARRAWPVHQRSVRRVSG